MKNLIQESIETQKLNTGTTTIAVKFNDVIILASDRQATLNFKAGIVQKIFMLTNHENFTGVAIAGSLADAVNLVNLMRSELKFYEFENGHIASVKTVASFLSTILHNSYRQYQPYFVQIIVGGVDITGNHIYSMDMIGSMTEENYASSGSGSLFALSKLEDT